MQELHLLESSKVNPQDVAKVGWAHALSDARAKKIGRTADQVIRDFNVYANEVDAKRPVPAEVALLVCLGNAVLSE